MTRRTWTRLTSRATLVVYGAALAAWSLTFAISIAAAPQDHDHGAPAAAATQHEAGAHVHTDAAKLVNPVKSTPTSIAAGKAIYDKQCVSCHGATGKADTKMAATLTPKPSDLTDASWKHGPSDGEMFTLLKDGAKNTAMKGYASKMTAQEMWSVVNYVRTLRQ